MRRRVGFWVNLWRRDLTRRYSTMLMSLAIGDLIAPSQPDTIYVGTGEPNFSAHCFFGVGIYRITNASTRLRQRASGPFEQKRCECGCVYCIPVGRIAVDPTNPDNIFVATTYAVLAPVFPLRFRLSGFSSQMQLPLRPSLPG